MKYYDWIPIVVFIIVLIVIILIIAGILWVIFRNGSSSFYPFNEGNVIRLSFLTEYVNSQAGFFNLSAEPNSGVSGCYNALVGSIEFTDKERFTVHFDPNNKSRFSLTTSSGTFAYLAENGVVSFGKITTDDTIWFSLTLNTDNNYVLTSNTNQNIGIIINSTCFDTPILALSSIIQPIHITNLTLPIRPPKVTFPFTNNQIIKISSGVLALTSACQGDVANFSASTINNMWTVVMSPDLLAFALLSNTRYLSPAIEIINGESITNLSSTSTLSNYNAGDYTNWFTLSGGNKLVSLLTNSSFFVNNLESVFCNGATASATYGSLISRGSILTFA